jgi:hypothetical protein
MRSRSHERCEGVASGALPAGYISWMRRVFRKANARNQRFLTDHSKLSGDIAEHWPRALFERKFVD